MKRASMAVEEMQHAAVNRDLEVEGGVVETIDRVCSNSQSFFFFLNFFCWFQY